MEDFRVKIDVPYDLWLAIKKGAFYNECRLLKLYDTSIDYSQNKKHQKLKNELIELARQLNEVEEQARVDYYNNGGNTRKN